MAPPFIEAGAPVLSLGHDNRLGPPGAPVCQSGYCLERFRRWLEDSYGGLDALNRAWGGRLTHWSQAQPFTLEKARDMGVYAPWLDFRRSMDRVFAGIHADGRSTLAALHPAAPAGISAASLGGLYTGRDWTMLAQRLPFLAVPSDPVVMARLRSHGTPGAVHGVFLEAGEDGAVERAAWLPWRAAFDGFSQVWRYPALAQAESPALGPMLDPWGRPTPATAALAGALSQANAGAGPLILRATPAPSRLAILDARENRYLDALLDTPGATDAAEAGFLRLAAGLGYAPEFLTPARLAETGGLPYRCVILPNARALSNAAVLALRSFSEAGGLLVADTPPADYDEHGAPRDGSALAAAFGLDDPPEERDAEQPAARFTPATDARGPALLLNAAPSGDEATLELAEALAAAELTPPLAVRRLTEEPFHGALRVWTYGEARIMGALLDWDAGDRRITIQLEEDRYLYDVLAGDSLGERDGLRLALKPGAPSLIAALPYEVTRLVLTAGPEALKPGGRLSFAVEVKTYGGLPGEHLVRARLLQRSPLDFSGAGGDPIPHYTHFISCAGGRGKGFFPLALDESPGAYAVEVTDVLTGTQARLNADVVPQRPETVPGD